MRERADVQARDRESQVTPVQLRLDDREAIVGVVRRPPAARRRSVTLARSRTRQVPAEALPVAEQLRGIEVDPGRDRVGQEVPERDLRRDPFGVGVAAADRAARRVGVDLRVERSR